MNKPQEEEFVKLLKEHQNIIHKICKLYTADDDAHKDLFQEITIQLWKAYPNFRGDAKFTTWAYRVGLNTAITLYRKKKKNIETISFDASFHKVKEENYSFEEEEKLKLLYNAINYLNDIEKALIFLYLEDKDYTEIAETLGISEVNARVKMNRVKGKLKNLVKT